MSGPLDGITVLDLSRLLPGPYCSLILADLGAEVIKIEDPNGGDYIRWFAPKWGDYSVNFMVLNRNKKSMTLNLKSDAGVEIFRKLVARADVVLESFRPGVMDRLGVGYEALSEINPRIVFCAISGYGSDGPYKDRAGHDLNYMAIAGPLSQAGRPGETAPPLPVQVADIAGGSLFGTIGILAALANREKTGRGAFVDTSMTDGAAALGILGFAGMWSGDGEPQRGVDKLCGGTACYEVYRTADARYISLGALEPKFFVSFCAAVERPDLLVRQFDEGEKRDSLYDEIAAIFAAKKLDEWREILKDHDFCCEPVNTFEEAERDEQLKSRGLFFEIDHPTAGKIKQLAMPLKISGCKKDKNTLAPALGAHNVELLDGLGLNAAEIEQLKTDKVI